MVRRFGVDVLVIDVALSDGSGEHTLATLEADGSSAAVVVFTAYAPDRAKLRRLGVQQVVDKPDLGLLRDVLAAVGTTLADAPVQADRRAASREVEQSPKLWRSPAGISSYQDLTHSLLRMDTGDAVLAITVVGLDGIETDVGPLLAADCRLAIAGILRDELRVQDLVHEAPEVHGFVALIRGGDARSRRRGVVAPVRRREPGQRSRVRSRGRPAGSTTSVRGTPSPERWARCTPRR